MTSKKGKKKVASLLDTLFSGIESALSSAAKTLTPNKIAKAQIRIQQVRDEEKARYTLKKSKSSSDIEDKAISGLSKRNRAKLEKAERTLGKLQERLQGKGAYSGSLSSVIKSATAKPAYSGNELIFYKGLSDAKQKVWNDVVKIQPGITSNSYPIEDRKKLIDSALLIQDKIMGKNGKIKPSKVLEYHALLRIMTEKDYRKHVLNVAKGKYISKDQANVLHSIVAGILKDTNAQKNFYATFS